MSGSAGTPAAPRIDIHQHLWTSRLIESLAERRAPPLVACEQGAVILHTASEAPYRIDVDGEAIDRRAALLTAGSLDGAAIMLSSPIGIEALPREESLALIGAYLDGVSALPAQFLVWVPIALDRPVPADVDAALARGSIGISIAAGAMTDGERLEEIGPILERAAALDAPVFVHPGPAPGERPIVARAGEPAWWQAMTAYVAQMQAAWLTFACFGRSLHPRLRIVFAMLAGGAPLLSERLQARSGPGIELDDPRTFYETSSYGHAAVRAMVCRVGERQLVFGSDRPVIEPVLTGRDELLQRNGGALLSRPAGAP